MDDSTQTNRQGNLLQFIAAPNKDLCYFFFWRKKHHILNQSKLFLSMSGNINMFFKFVEYQIKDCFFVLLSSVKNINTLPCWYDRMALKLFLLDQKFWLSFCNLPIIFCRNFGSFLLTELGLRSGLCGHSDTLTFLSFNHCIAVFFHVICFVKCTQSLLQKSRLFVQIDSGLKAPTLVLRA